MAQAPSAERLGQPARFVVDVGRRIALTRCHTVFRDLNKIALRDYDPWITGAQIGVDCSRIAFKIEGFSQQLVLELEAKVNSVLANTHTLRTFFLPDAEFHRRPDLLRTLKVQPPVSDGQVRVVAIEGFDEHACGGTHVHSISELGRFSIFQPENKGKINKRLYVRLDCSAVA